jgi:hypothetical protein
MPKSLSERQPPKSLSNENIPEKIKLYQELFNKLFLKTRLAKHRLDLYRDWLENINSWIQLSVVWFSAGSSLVQALTSNSYTFDFTSFTNTTDEIYSIQQDISDTNHTSEIIKVITLSVSTYSTLLLSVVRHLRLEEKYSNVTSLRDSFVNLTCRIKYNLDLLDPWGYVEYYKDNHEQKVHDWHSFIKKIDEEYGIIVENIQSLFITYNIILHTSLYKKYAKLFPLIPAEKDLNKTDKSTSCWATLCSNYRGA